MQFIKNKNFIPILTIFVLFISIFSSTSWSMTDIEEIQGGRYYKIRNQYSGNILNGWGLDTGKSTATMAMDAQDGYQSHRLWKFEKQDNGYYKIRNQYSGNILNGWGSDTGKGTATMAMDAQDGYQSHRLWSIH